MEMKAYLGGTPAHVQVHVPPGTAAVEYFEDGVVVAIVIHDIVSLDDIAAAKDATLTRVDLNPEATGEPDPAEAVESSPEWRELSFTDLKKMASEAKIKGRSAMDKDQLIEALSG